MSDTSLDDGRLCYKRDKLTSFQKVSRLRKSRDLSIFFRNLVCNAKLVYNAKLWAKCLFVNRCMGFHISRRINSQQSLTLRFVDTSNVFTIATFWSRSNNDHPSCGLEQVDPSVKVGAWSRTQSCDFSHFSQFGI